MRMISQSPDPLARMHTMTERKGKSGTIDVKALLAGDEEFLRALVRTALQEVLEVEMVQREWLRDKLLWRQIEIGAAERREPLADRFSQVRLRLPMLGSDRLADDRPRLGFHGTAMAGRARAQTLFGRRIDIAKPFWCCQLPEFRS
jgi:hypothetical protein